MEKKHSDKAPPRVPYRPISPDAHAGVTSRSRAEPVLKERIQKGGKHGEGGGERFLPKILRSKCRLWSRRSGVSHPSRSACATIARGEHLCSVFIKRSKGKKWAFLTQQRWFQYVNLTCSCVEERGVGMGVSLK